MLQLFFTCPTGRLQDKSSHRDREILLVLFSTFEPISLTLLVTLNPPASNPNAPSRSFRATKQLCPHPEGAGPPCQSGLGGLTYVIT